MSKTLRGIAEELREKNKKVQLIYGFNGAGKTRLSREFKDLIDPKTGETKNDKTKFLYYSAFTEDLFYWDNDLGSNANRKLIIQDNSFTKWVLNVQGQDKNAITHFQRYTSDNLEPDFSEDFSEATFFFRHGNGDRGKNIKISKGEESIFVWSIFYSLLKQVIGVLDESKDRETNRFDELKYVFIDDPVSSLDEEHLIQLAVDLASLIKPCKSKNNKLKFIITTHNPLFYNVLYHGLTSQSGWLLEKFEDGTFNLEEKFGRANKSFSYHLHLKQILENAINNDQIEKYHFTLLRNLYEKTASFLGYREWRDLLPDEKELYHKRIIDFTSHSTLSNEVVAEPTPEEKKIISFLLKHLIENYSYWQKEKKHD